MDATPSSARGDEQRNPQLFQQLDRMASELQRERTLRESALESARRSFRDREQFSRQLREARHRAAAALEQTSPRRAVTQLLQEVDQLAAVAEDSLASTGLLLIARGTPASVSGERSPETRDGRCQTARNRSAAEARAEADDMRVERFRERGDKLGSVVPPLVRTLRSSQACPEISQPERTSAAPGKAPSPAVDPADAAGGMPLAQAPEKPLEMHTPQPPRHSVISAEEPDCGKKQSQVRAGSFSRAMAGPQWQSNSSRCMLCATAFSTMVWRHHCRRCGFCICDRCSPYRLHLDLPLERQASPLRKAPSTGSLPKGGQLPRTNSRGPSGSAGEVGEVHRVCVACYPEVARPGEGGAAPVPRSTSGPGLPRPRRRSSSATSLVKALLPRSSAIAFHGGA